LICGWKPSGFPLASIVFFDEEVKRFAAARTAKAFTFIYARILLKQRIITQLALLQ
jgi:hypothetical protein